MSSQCATIEAAAPATDTLAAIDRVLRQVAETGRVVDACATRAAIDATWRLRVRANLPVLRDIARLNHGPVDDRLEEWSIDDAIAHSLQVLTLFDDAEATELARQHLSGPAAVAGSVLITLNARHDWASTSAVTARLIADPDPHRNYSFVSLALEFLRSSPEIPLQGCEAMRHVEVFEALSQEERKQPTVARIIELRRELLVRYRCDRDAAQP